MQKPRICVSLVDSNYQAISEVESLTDFFEVRLDLVGPEWPELVKNLRKPWIACNRSPEEGGKGHPDETKREEELLRAVELGAAIVDIEHNTTNLGDILPLIKPRARCLLSCHNLADTPDIEILKGIVESQLESGADICKIVTNALSFEDNLTVLRLIQNFPEVKIVAFAMGEGGKLSRILCPLAGGYFTYGSVTEGKEAASGQLTVTELTEIYRIITI